MPQKYREAPQDNLRLREELDNLRKHHDRPVEHLRWITNTTSPYGRCCKVLSITH
jgi:hypothetical protein